MRRGRQARTAAASGGLTFGNAQNGWHLILKALSPLTVLGFGGLAQARHEEHGIRCLVDTYTYQRIDLLGLLLGVIFLVS